MRGHAADTTYMTPPRPPPPGLGTADAEIKVIFGFSKSFSLSFPLTHFQPGVGQVLSNAKGFVFLVYSASLFSSQYHF